MNILTSSQVERLKEMTTFALPKIKSMFLSTGSACRVHIFEGDKLVYSTDYYYFCLEILVDKLVNNNFEDANKLIHTYFELKRKHGLNVIDFLYDYYSTSKKDSG